MTTKQNLSQRTQKSGGIESYFRRVFGLMAGAVGLTAITTFIMLIPGAWVGLIRNGGLSAA